MHTARVLGAVLQKSLNKTGVVASLNQLYCRQARYSSSQKSIRAQECESIDDEVQTNELDPFQSVDLKRGTFIDQIAPPMKRSFNLASYVNSSPTLQELIKVGVSLFDIENIYPQSAKRLLHLDFERDCVKYMKFLADSGLKPRNLGRFITEFPDLFFTPILELQTRLDYLKKKNFSSSQIAKMLNRSAYLLSQPIKTVDYKLGALQVEFQLHADVVRDIISEFPAMLMHPEEQFKLVKFSLSDECGFAINEIQAILKEQPKIMDLARPDLVKRFDLVHNIIGLDHETIVQFPKLLTGPELDIKHRFLYLRKLKRDQFNPKKPLYVQPSTLYNLDDEEFCKRCAKTNLSDYKLFVKTCL